MSELEESPVENNQEDRYAMEQVVSFILDSIEICGKHNRPDGQLGFIRVLQTLRAGQVSDSLAEAARQMCDGHYSITKLIEDRAKLAAKLAAWDAARKGK